MFSRVWYIYWCLSYFTHHPSVPIRLTDVPNRLDVRLVNGSYISQGRVEVYCGGQWGTICEVDDNFGQQEGNAICRQLGYTHASGINTLTISWVPLHASFGRETKLGKLFYSCYGSTHACLTQPCGSSCPAHLARQCFLLPFNCYQHQWLYLLLTVWVLWWEWVQILLPFQWRCCAVW